ncbi:RNA-binding protein 4-like [Hemicordylus capensis]|uniref:RNA-binding protein 4-like n=1 Tax=Hemicordylus capensis TaxID=884348 RepID=UPI002303E747|nr:RNA-binding protein 4-like [Hemicordylus capensis]XP_053134276.1 RNA-binding protein 4-like [Hemicordylus capensis]XP_053134277.1 RNA-binding protein 4-like [Hemicordylus capensis]
MVKIFVGGLSPVVTAEELRKLFEQYGQVNECDILKNFAFVHMEKEDEAHQAISALHKSEFYGAHLTVEYATSKIRNATKIYVGNVSAKATTSQVRQLFERFGKVVECDIVKNYAFVHMAKEREAMDAILHLNDTPLEDQKIFVTLSKSNSSLRAAKAAAAAAAAATVPTPAPSYYFSRGRVPPPAPTYSPYCPRAWYDREYCGRYSYELYDRARAAYDRALPPPPPPPPAAYRERSPMGRRTATSTAVVAQYPDPYTAAAAAAAAAATAAANQTYSQAYSQPGYAAAAAAAATYSQYSIGTAYNVAEYYERYASAYAAQYAQTF